MAELTLTREVGAECAVSRVARPRRRGTKEVTVVDPPKRKKKAYPISTFTYAFVPTNAAQGALLKSFVGYAITGGQTFGPSLDFSPLPQSIVNANEATLNSIS